jgi:hypothetical protein
MPKKPNAKNSASTKLESIVVLTAYDERGVVVERENLTYEEFYESTGHLIDDNARIKKLGIRVIAGEIYDSTAKIQSNFMNLYSADGVYAGGRSVHADGTVCEH